MNATKECAVVDPFGAAADERMPFLREALDPAVAEMELIGCLPAEYFHGQGCRLRSIRVTRHKPGRRCLIAYELAAPDGSGTRVLLGKSRAKGLDKETFRRTQRLRQAGFDDVSGDGVSVPRPAGVIPRFQMWLQHQVAGSLVTELLSGPAGMESCRRAADAIFKLHQTPLETTRRHTIDDELRILQERLAPLCLERPEWSAPLDRLLERCEVLGRSLPAAQEAGIHRDFYPDQLLACGSRLYLLDLDLYARGDPAVDAGNFLAHIAELSLRVHGDVEALADRETAFLRRYLELAGVDRQPIVEAYRLLTLVRHIGISASMPGRRRWTGPLLELCEHLSESDIARKRRPRKPVLCDFQSSCYSVPSDGGPS